MNIINRIWKKTKSFAKKTNSWFWIFFNPSERSWQLTSRIVVFLGSLFILAIFFTNILAIVTFERALGYLVIVAFMVAVGFVAFLALQLLFKFSKKTLLAIALFTPFMLAMLSNYWGGLGTFIFIGTILLFLSMTINSLLAIKGNSLPLLQQKRVLMFLFVGVIGSGGLSFLFFGSQDRPNELHDAFVMVDHTLDLSNPNTKGTHKVEFLTYGSGTDLHRPEYAEGVTIKTESVDGSKLVDQWEGLVGWSRSSYWGHDETELPRQGRVWMPEGQGPFPLVLIVHGNHVMEDFSDPGYQYMGELMASRGYIFVSVDENFLNFSYADFINPLASGIGRENDARGWMLLEHLKLFRQWSTDTDSLFFGKVDMDNIALMGHSRGGEAVAVAAAFNGLKHYPDDATLAFDYNFNIKGIIAIAPVDGQYKPRARPTPLSNINYFTIHGSADGDVDSFMGMSQYERIVYSDDAFNFKSSLYIAEANHGQFNTGWGRRDFGGGFWGYFLDTEHIISAEKQRQIGLVYFSAFLDVTLKDANGYLPLFQDSSFGMQWLPNNFYVNNYSDNKTQWLARYEEDIDPGTGHNKGINITTSNLSQWKELWPDLIYNTLDTHLVRLAWDQEVTTEPASYTIHFGKSSVTTNSNSQLVFSVAHGGSNTLPNGFEEDNDESGAETSDEDSIEDSIGDSIEEKSLKKLEENLLDWHMVFTDNEGNQAKLLLSDYQFLYPELMRQTRRLNFLYDAPQSEIVLRRYAISFVDFQKINNTLNLNSLISIAFVFDQGEKGALWLNDVGITESAQ